EELRQAAAVDVLHHNVELPGLLSDLVDRDRVRMIEPGRKARLADETLDLFRRARLLETQLLDRDVALERRILRQPDDAHPALTELAAEDVLRELLRRC